MKPDSSSQKTSEKAVPITDRPDDWLLREWKKGNEQAAGVFFDRYWIRLVTLVAKRLNRRFRPAIVPDDVVQSAMGSFFNAARHSRIEISGSVSLWRLLATFARRKMRRKIERHIAAKRGGDHTRISVDGVEPIANSAATHPDDEQASELLQVLKSELPEELRVVIEGLLAGQSQRELAETLKINERTVRRRLSRAGEHLIGEGDTRMHQTDKPPSGRFLSPTSLPSVGYNEFVLGKLIGSGGFGKVYRASLQSDGRTVAVKFLRKAFWENEDARRSFVREINLASRIQHAGVIRYLGYGESPHGGPYLLSEWIEGQTFYDAAKSSVEQFNGWLIQICQAIEVVHQAGLVHGDLTPSNILVDKNDRIIITDFGFSQATASSSTVITGGTLGFAAPEQIDPCFGTIGPTTDIYAIGGLVHWFLFGTPPNTGDSLAEIVDNTTRARKLRFTDSQMPYRSILQAALSPSPADRSHSASELLRLLR